MKVPALNPRLQFIKSGEFMPSKFRTSLRIAANLSAAASTTSANVVFAANNLNDPLLSSGTAKCVGYNQLAALYNKYRVLGSKIEMICAMSTTITTGTAQISGAVCIAPSNTGLGRTLFSDAISQPFAKWVDITSSTPKKMTLVMATSKLVGIKAPEASSELAALISAGPAEPTYWMITYVSDGNYVTSFVVMDIQMTYDVEFYDRNEIDRSSLDGKQIESHYEEIFKLRCKTLADAKEKKPHNSSLPLNKAKGNLGLVAGINQYESKESGLSTTDLSHEDDDWAPIEVLKSKAKEAQRKLSQAEYESKLETASRKGK